MSDEVIRPGGERDLPALVVIYNHYVETTHITFDTEPFTVETRRPWLERFAETGCHRLLVAERAGRAVGYASSLPFRDKPAYDRSVETTIYLEAGAVGAGLGKRLYGELIDALRDDPLAHRAYAGVTLPNTRSIALHERMGFEPVGIFREAGYKFDAFWDVSWLELDVSSSTVG
jgi:phosphinothricin acetyltransferase